MSPRRRGTLKVSAIVAATAIAGCMVGPDYERPDLTMPSSYRDAKPIPSLSSGEASIADLPWWKVFDDPQLVALIDEGLRNNRDLRAAIARIDAARGVRAQVVAPLFPQVGYGGDVSRGKNESFGGIAPDGGETQWSGAVGVNVAWELDIWGRIRRADEAALAVILQTEEARRALMLSIVSEVAAGWFTLIGLDAQIEISRKNAVSFGESVQLFTDRAEGGVASDLPVFRARALEAQAQAAVPELERRMLQLENALCVLVGRTPGSILRAAALPAPQPPEIPVGLPSQLLERRPDVRQAEAAVRQASAEIGVATADFFPRLGLTTILGRASPDLESFSSTWNVWSIAANLAGPIYTGGALTGQLNRTQARFVENVAQYEQVVLNALADASNALIERTKLAEAAVYQRVRVESLQQSVAMSLLRFDLGRASYFEVLDSQQQLFPAELAQAETATNQLVAFTRLYRALGGGWTLSDAEWIPTAAPESARSQAQ